MTSAQRHTTFGRPKPPHTVVIARGEKVRYFTVRPWALALSTVLASAAAIGIVGSAAYLAFYDDLETAGVARQAHLAQGYEDRIAALRSQLDRTVSRQLIDREKVENKVAVLLDQQVELDARYDRLEPLLDQARSSGLIPPAVPIPAPSPGAVAAPGPAPLGYAPEHAALDRFRLIDRHGWKSSASDEAGKDPTAISPELLREIGKAVETHEAKQIENLDALAQSARTKADGIAKALASEGLPATASARPSPASDTAGEGGPFVPVPEGYRFEASCDDLEAALSRLDAVTSFARKLPIERPVASQAISSTFGVRSDPFLGRSAMHTGIDFVATSGTSVRATAAGTVVSAGPNGGYGQMVEVDHGGGFVTRYAHLSTILVRVGDSVPAGGTVGEVGSTGRSTGPHLHYEVRRGGEAVDPAGFLRAGSKIRSLG